MIETPRTTFITHYAVNAHNTVSRLTRVKDIASDWHRRGGRRGFRNAWRTCTIWK